MRSIWVKLISSRYTHVPWWMSLSGKHANLLHKFLLFVLMTVSRCIIIPDFNVKSSRNIFTPMEGNGYNTKFPKKKLFDLTSFYLVRACITIRFAFIRISWVEIPIDDFLMSFHFPLLLYRRSWDPVALIMSYSRYAFTFFTITGGEYC